MIRRLSREFLAFIQRGNVVDLAVAVIIGAAFTKIVNAVVELITTEALKPSMQELGISHLDLVVKLDRFAQVSHVIDHRLTSQNMELLSLHLLLDEVMNEVLDILLGEPALFGEFGFLKWIVWPLTFF